MALSANDAFAAGGRGRRRRGGRGRRGALSEINVTPLVDVMLVLLIVFMISAPLLTAGVPVELPKTEAGSLQDQAEPLTVSIRADGQLFIKEDEVPFGVLAPRLQQMAGPNSNKPIYVRADGKAPYAIVAQVMAALSTSGFTAINLITDTGGPSSGGQPAGSKLATVPGEPDRP
ncbi:ExbD/TolR family protein [Phenylobacterium sp.]|jgi:biopolymer transport protein TolR|uniref:ExbD/TolR family protein n=1 Tax=Phenylobacterium sp. TaxID=1871053 RepID=UPI002E32A917|nr:ExbD/TolR family protein [Phenylobacterium sp.]HEX3367084.1 ExbD/TolR family protein [Phenylobacterium sp.]